MNSENKAAAAFAAKRLRSKRGAEGGESGKGALGVAFSGGGKRRQQIGINDMAFFFYLQIYIIAFVITLRS